MRPLLRRLTALGAATLAAGLATGLLAAPATAKPAITLTPTGLPRGADVAVPHLEGTTVVDGAVRVDVKAPTVRLLGKTGADYVVGTADKQGGHGRIYRVTAQGATTLLARANVYQTLLSGDGARVIATHSTRTAKGTITAYDATTGARIASHTFTGYPYALDGEGDRVLIGGIDKTFIWTTTTDSLATVTARAGYLGDLSSDVVATFTKDTYDGGCTVVSRISTGARLWRSCTEAVAAFSTDATRIATVGIMSDGPGPGRVDARTISGQHLGRYQVRSGWFGQIRFESPTALLLEVNGARKAFTARCTGTVCERASALRPAETLRTAS
jgi:hypothetical protein